LASNPAAGGASSTSMGAGMSSGTTAAGAVSAGNRLDGVFGIRLGVLYGLVVCLFTGGIVAFV
jgi:hypothetical protein